MTTNQPGRFQVESLPDSKILTTGLFGNCDKSTWRDAFIQEAETRGWYYYNPQLPAGTWETAPEWFPVLERMHLDADQIVLFMIDGSSYALGSLAETGFSLLSAIANLSVNRHVIVLIDKETDSEMCPNPDLRKESHRAKRLVRAKLEGMRYDNVYLVDTKEEMMMVWQKLHEIIEEMNPLAQYTLSSRNASLVIPQAPTKPTPSNF